MTKTQIKKKIEKQMMRSISTAQLDRRIAECGIEPLGARQRPQNYPSDSADKILKHLGYR
jgi:hypothetical protein